MEVSPGGWLLLALLWYLDTEHMFLLALLAAAAHELGHFFALKACGGKLAAVRLTAMGAEMKISAATVLSPLQRLICDLAGPLVNLALALWAAHQGKLWGDGAYLFAGLSLSLALFNLLPLHRLDGGRAVADLCAWLWSEELGARLGAVCEQVLLLLLIWGGILLLWKEKNGTLLVTAVGLFALNLRERRAWCD